MLKIKAQLSIEKEKEAKENTIRDMLKIKAQLSIEKEKEAKRKHWL